MGKNRPITIREEENKVRVRISNHLVNDTRQMETMGNGQMPG